jgi:ABC-2 type transport system ATP-binding protein
VSSTPNVLARAAEAAEPTRAPAHERAAERARPSLAPTGPRVLEVAGLTVRYGDHVALAPTPLAITAGERVALVGPNGAGKSTLLGALATLGLGRRPHPALRGGPATRAAWVRHVGYCPQANTVWPELTAHEQLTLVARTFGLSRADARARADAWLGRLGLDDKRDALARTLSGGMARRLSIALSAVHEPAVLLLDEPSAGLDPESRARVAALVGAPSARAVVWATHDLDEAARLATRVVLLDRGVVIADDTPERLTRGDAAEAPYVLDLEHAAPERLADALADEVPALTRTPRGVRLPLRADDATRTAARLLSTLARRGVEPRRVELRPRTLADVFVERVGRPLDP